MTIHAASKHFYQLLIAIGFISLLASCGGGGSSGPKKDSTPNAFTFAPITNAAVSTEVTSAPVTIGGINQSVSISVSGGAYSIGGGAFTSAVGTITNGQVVTVKVKSSDKTNTPVTATLTVGGVSAAFTVTTLPDVTPDAFTFTPATGAGAKVVTPSNEITVTGLDVAVPVSITNGEYSMNGGAFTNVAGIVNKDQKITVRAISSETPSTDVTAVLTIGGVTGSFVVTTRADEAAPTAQILFPPPVSMTEGNTILVRGSASDEFSTIASVKVNGVLATTTDGFKNWQALVSLADTSKPITATTANTLKVVTEDSVGNISDDSIQVKITQADMSIAFPNANNSFLDIYGVVVDRYEGRNRVLVNDYSVGVISVDLSSGERTVFSGINSLKPSFVIDEVAQRLYAIRENFNTIFFSFDLKDGSKYEEYVNEYLGDSTPNGLAVNHNITPAKIVGISLDNGDIYSTTPSFLTLDPFSTGTVPNSNNIINNSWGIVFDSKGNRYLAADEANDRILSIDAITGVRTIFSSNAVGAGEAFGELYNGSEPQLTAIQIDEVSNRVLVFENRVGKLISVDLATGNRTLISSMAESNSDNIFRHSYGVTVVSPNSYALVTVERSPLHALFAVDLLTGKRVIFSKSAGASPY